MNDIPGTGGRGYRREEKRGMGKDIVIGNGGRVEGGVGKGGQGEGWSSHFPNGADGP